LTGFIVDAFVNDEIRFIETRIQTVKTTGEGTFFKVGGTSAGQKNYGNFF